jgi:hypothetical protein
LKKKPCFGCPKNAARHRFLTSKALGHTRWATVTGSEIGYSE